MPCATSPSAIACTSSGCMPQKSAICVKVSAVFSISHTAVALGISGSVMAVSGSVMAGGYDNRLRVGQGHRSGLCWDVPHGRQGMIEEDEGPVRKRVRLEKLVLDTLGITELRDYIDELKAEIARVEADIDRKQGHRSAADAFFRKP